MYVISWTCASISLVVFYTSVFVIYTVSFIMRFSMAGASAADDLDFLLFFPTFFLFSAGDFFVVFFYVS